MRSRINLSRIGPGGRPDASPRYPSAFAPSGWWRLPYAGSPLVDISGNSRDVSQGTGSLVPATTGTLNQFATPTFDGTDDYLLRALSLSPSFLDLFAGSWTWSVLCKFTGTTVDPGAGSRHLACNVLSDSGGWQGLVITTTGPAAYFFTGNQYKECKATADVSGWVALQTKYDGTNLKVRANNGTWGSVACGRPDGTNHLRIGKSFDGVTFKGQIADVSMYKAALSDRELDNLLMYYDSRYGLRLFTP